MRTSVLLGAALLLLAGCVADEDIVDPRPDEETPATEPAEDEPPGRYGKFVGEFIFQWLPNGRDMRVVQEIKYIDPSGVTWIAPENHVVDGASIPRQLWAIAGAPFSGKYRKASVFHDAACDEKQESWEDVHRLFYHACRCAGVEETAAKKYYAAVRYCGPRWDAEGNDIASLCSTISEPRMALRLESPPRDGESDGAAADPAPVVDEHAKLRELMQQIENGEVTLEQLEERTR